MKRAVCERAPRARAGPFVWCVQAVAKRVATFGLALVWDVCSCLQVLKQRGVLGLWDGTLMSVQRSAVLTAAQAASYDHLKHQFLAWGMADGPRMHVLCSLCAGVSPLQITPSITRFQAHAVRQSRGHSTPRSTLNVWQGASLSEGINPSKVLLKKMRSIPVPSQLCNTCCDFTWNSGHSLIMRNVPPPPLAIPVTWPKKHRKHEAPKAPRAFSLRLRWRGGAGVTW